MDLSRFGRLAQNAKNAVAGRRSRGTARSGVVSKPQEGRPRFQLLAQWRQRIEDARRSGSFVDQAGQYAETGTVRGGNIHRTTVGEGEILHGCPVVNNPEETIATITARRGKAQGKIGNGMALTVKGACESGP